MAEFEDMDYLENHEDVDLLGDDDGDDDEIDWDAAFDDQNESNEKIAEDTEAEHAQEREEKLAAIRARKEARDAAKAGEEEAASADPEEARSNLDDLEDYDPLKDVPEEYFHTRRGRDARIIPYDFRRPIQLSKGFFRNLNIVGESYAKLLTLTLSNYLRVPASVSCKAVRQVLFEEYTKHLPNPSCINILEMEPIKVPGMLDLDLGLVFTMMEKLLGSHTLGNNVRREFTSIETRVTRKIINRMLNDLRESFLRLLEVNISLSSIEHNPDFTYIMNANDPCIVLEFHIELADFEGPMSLCISLAALDAEIGNEGISGYRDVRSESDRQRDECKVGKVLDSTRESLTAEIATRELNYAEACGLKVGDVINLRKQISEPMVIRLGECAVFEAKMGRCNRKTAFKVTRILWPNQDTLSGILENYKSEGTEA